MKKTRRRLLILSPFLFLFFTWLYAKWTHRPFNKDTLSKTGDIATENILLETELKIASKPATYVLLDLAEKKIYLKIKGMILKEFKIADLEIIGNQRISNYYNLTGREERQAPKRIEIKPEGNKDKPPPAPPPMPDTPATNPADATFDIEDMPSDYTLLLNNDLSIALSSKLKDGSMKSLSGYLHDSKARINNLFSIMQSRLDKKKFIKIGIVMEKEDVNSLYWSLPDGAEVIIKS